MAVAGTAAYFSVKGIGTLFAGAFWAAIVMATVLEVSKLVCTSFLYRYWKKIGMLLKVYMTSAVIILVGITSVGIYGFLSAAYQTSSTAFETFKREVAVIESDKVYINDELKFSKEKLQSLMDNKRQINESIKEIFNRDMGNNDRRGSYYIVQFEKEKGNLIKNQQEQISEIDKEIKNTQNDISKIATKLRNKDLEINKLKEGVADKKDILTFQFVADALGLELDTVVRWFILIIVLVFDPIAVSLVLAYNIAVYNDEEEENEKKKTDKPKTKKKIEEKEEDKVVDNSEENEEVNLQDFDDLVDDFESDLDKKKVESTQSIINKMSKIKVKDGKIKNTNGETIFETKKD